MSAFVMPIVALVRLLCDPLAKRLRYLKDIRSNSEILKLKTDELVQKCNDLSREVQRAVKTGKIPTDEAINWLDKASILKDCAPWLIKEADLHRGCFSVWCINCCTSYKLGKKISRTTDFADELLNKRINSIKVDPLPEKLLPFPTRAIKENSSAAVTMEQIMRYLSDSKTRKIGLWGNRGIGKSTILKNIYNNFEGTTDYDAIILVEFNKDGSSKKLLADIVAELSLDTLKEENEGRLCRLLYHELKKKKFLLIVDDLSEVIDLQKLRVPNPNDQNGCKILIASVKREICSSMAVDVEIKLSPLPEDEAWELFCETVGFIPRDVEEIAPLVCIEGAGRASLLIRLGTFLRNQQLLMWERALAILKSIDPQVVDSEELVQEIMTQTHASIDSRYQIEVQNNKQILRRRVNSNYPIDKASKLYGGTGAGPSRPPITTGNSRHINNKLHCTPIIVDKGEHTPADRPGTNTGARSRVPQFGEWDVDSSYSKIFERVRENRIHENENLPRIPDLESITEAERWRHPNGNHRRTPPNGLGCFRCCGHIYFCC